MRIVGKSARAVDRHRMFEVCGVTRTEPKPTSRFSVRRRRASATHRSVGLAVGLVLLGAAGCGRAREEHKSATVTYTAAAKPEFIVAADRICARHLESILAWLETPQTGNVWQQRAAQNEGIYRIIATTITRLHTLGPPRGPTADAFAGYLKTLKARAVLYRLTAMADLRHDQSFAAQLQRRVDQIKPIGDRDAHRYGLHIRGTGPRDIAPPLDQAGSIRD